MTVAEALRVATARLAAAGIDGAARDARMLMAHALDVPADRLMLMSGDPAPDIGALVAARIARQPVAQIIGHRLFWGRRFAVTRDTLDPRPETETLIALALAQPFTSVLDLGTGTGAILLTLMAETGASGLGADLSPAALAVAEGNARALNLPAGFMISDWFAEIEGRFDLIVSNPPYIAEAEMAGLSRDVLEWEPHLALTPGGDGLGPYRTIAAGATRHLNPKGRLMVEIGPTQGGAVAAMFRAAGLDAVAVHPDIDGRDRVVSAQLPG
ncbi:peptide chain release factor N(5)-glutamine methyltransferase [Cereibacter sp. SYSU M97828]|nr:peptide chain release factor N(5)-glutamine methyltransferase [Cereibacter flavus]